ncbi:hypothetical protein [Holospora curviuscula]|uniref:Uncharacterized protein n=1 Tax=Holospora curviuscula TaxID=1082868 RepID=A0A2S5R8R4_9PROT|nr:hypothetical protein [Holospora curviuscula]PPE03708.1 hypothetical protein HCUR_00847 [Holospora curviuscula]
MGSTLRPIGLLPASLEGLTCWVKKIILTHILENRGVVLDNAAFHQGKAR